MSFNDLLLNMMSGQFPGPKKVIDRTEIENGLKVSTVDTYDYGLETAIVQTDNLVHVVERYESEENAKIGHEKWVGFAKDGIGKEITAIYFGGDQKGQRIKFILK
jgi:hypothetical protein